MPASRRIGALAILAIGAVALGAGCGGDGDDSGLSADEFRSQVDAVCARFDDESNDLDDPTSAEDVLPFLEANIDLQEEQLNELQAITPPDEFADDYQEALELGQTQIDQLQGVVDDIEGGADPVEAVNEAGDDFEANSERLSELADDIGLEECGNNSVNSSDDTDTSTDDTLDDATTDETTEADTVTETDTDTSAPTEGSIATYIDDVTDAAQALVAFGTILQNVDSADELESQSAEARAELDKFDAAIQQMSTYTLDNARLESQRAGLVETGDDVSSSLNEFLDAAEDGDTARVQELVPEVTQALQDFQAAASGSNP
jgi:hypothetical protein